MADPENPLITVSGPPASGTSTLAEGLAEELNYEFISGGDIFRRMAEERDMSLQEFTELAGDDPSIDKEVDDRLKDVIQSHLRGERVPDGNGLIVESRLAAWHADGDATLSVHLDADSEERLRRIGGREETLEEIQEREESERERYYEYYGIDVTDKSVYDLELDTTNIGEEEMVEQVKQFFLKVAISSC